MPANDYDAALSYQSGNYCMLIWDNYNTNSADALKSLTEILKTEEEKAAPVLLKVNALSMENWKARDYTTEVLTSAANLYSMEDAQSPCAALHCIQTCINYLANVCHQSTTDMNESLANVNRAFIALGYQEIEVEE